MALVDELLAAVAAAPASVALFCDFDGTLAPIVAEPAGARPLPGAVDVLAALVTRLGRVAVISGRPLTFLAPLVPAAIDIAALYGLERRIDGVASVDPAAAPWEPAIARATEAARDRFAHTPGVVVEPKGLSLTVHFRQAPDLAADVERWAAKEAAKRGLVRRGAKASVELHPPVATDKGTVLTDWAVGAQVVVFVGDDVGDLSAFDALSSLSARSALFPSVRTIAVAVDGPEAPATLLARADLVVNGPAGVLALCQRLLTAAS